MLGGKSGLKKADDEIQQICNKAQFENGLQGYPMFRVIEYKSQVVNGVNYFIKVQVDDDGSCIYLRLYVPIGAAKIELVGLEEGHNLSSQLF